GAGADTGRQGECKNSSRHTERSDVQTARQGRRPCQRARTRRPPGACYGRSADPTECRAAREAAGVRRIVRRRKHPAAKKLFRARERIPPLTEFIFAERLAFVLRPA